MRHRVFRPCRPLRTTRHARWYRFERLEPRTLLATFLVNTVSDSNNPSDPTLSPREAIQVSNGTLAAMGQLASARSRHHSGRPGRG
jgi:hypothetical protein